MAARPGDIRKVAINVWTIRVRTSEVRNFVRAVVSKQPAGGTDQALTEFAEWLNWALAEADRIDPLRQPVESLLAFPAKGDAIA